MTKLLSAFEQAGLWRFADIRAFCEASPYCLRVTERGSLYGLRYNRGTSDFRSPVVRQARGIVLEKDSNRIVSWAFDKFYEYGEDGPSYRDRPNLRQSVSDPRVRYERKYDGVLIKVVRRADGELLVSTNGKIDAAEAPARGPSSTFSYSVVDGDLAEPCTAGSSERQLLPGSLREVFSEAGGLELPFEEGYCYAFELLHPELSTVAPAKRQALVHLTTRRLEGNFEELPPELRFQGGSVQAAEVVSFRSFGACRDAARMLPWDDEGFVVAESSGSRVKVKSEAYMALQRLLAKDSECEDDDAVAVALTLHLATSPLPSGPERLIRDWRARLEALASACAARGHAARASFGGLRGRAAQLHLERALGGRIPSKVRGVVAIAIRDWIVEGSAGACNVDRILVALRQSRLSLSEIVTALRYLR